MSFGKLTIERAAEDVIKNLSSSEKKRITENILIWPEVCQNDIIFQALSQSHWTQSSISIVDSYFFTLISDLIQTGKIFLNVLDVDSWAFNDINIEKNNQLISKHSNRYDFWIRSGPNAGSDGFLQARTNFKFRQIGDVDKYISLDDYKGQIEIGTNPISKSVFTIINQGSLIRLPYAIDSINPSMFLFYYPEFAKIKNKAFAFLTQTRTKEVHPKTED